MLGTAFDKLRGDLALSQVVVVIHIFDPIALGRLLLEFGHLAKVLILKFGLEVLDFLRLLQDQAHQLVFANPLLFLLSCQLIDAVWV